MSEMTLESLGAMYGANVYDSTGEKIGAVEEIFYDDRTQRPEWIGIGTGFFGTKRVLVPVHGSTFDGDAVTVPYDKEQVKSSPDIDADVIAPDMEADLSAYYGVPAADAGALDQGLGRDVDSAGDAAGGQATVTRSEEELHVGKREAEAGAARLRKWVETEPVEADVELRRETARVVRERVDEPVSGVEVGDEAIEVTLMEERPVIAKETVAKERIRIEKGVETTHETVSDEVRRERVDVEGDVLP
jgi:sporulation protein YlmC with PRC-barrel domain